jgi:uncharacterized protein YfaS (alpha-2-macroglobulin family)
MNPTPDPARRIDAYLDAVARNLAHKPDAVRRDILAGLREHIGEALRREGDTPPPGAIERILGGMDAPDEFAETVGEDASRPDPSAPAAPRLSRHPHRGFVLAVAFLLVNVYGVWKWTAARPPAAVPPPNPSAVSNAPAALQLLKVEQMNWSAGRELTLRLVFNAAPNRDLLTRFLHLSTDHQPEVAYRLQGPANTNSLWIETDAIADDQVKYLLDEGFPGLSGVEPSEQAYAASVKLAPSFYLVRLSARSPAFDPPALQAEFNAYPESNGLDACVEIEPAVRCTFDGSGGWHGLRLAGDFKPGQVYAVTFKTGLRAENGAALEKPITRLVQFPNRASDLRFETGGRYLSPKGSLAIPVQAVNIKKWTVSLRPVFANNLVALALREANGYSSVGYSLDELAGAAVSQTNALTAPPNESVRAWIHLRELTQEPRGVFWVEANDNGRLIVVTDLGIAARLSPGGALVWINSLASGRPVAGAEITLVARNNQTLARAVTDAHGVARLAGWKAGETPFLITARREDDLSYLDLSDTRVDPGTGVDGAPYLAPGALEAAVFTERGVYRPGETAFLQGLVRDTDQRAPAPFPAIFRVRRPDGRVFQDIPVMTDAHGSARTTVLLPDYLPTGRYTVNLVMPGTFTVLGTTSIALEDFVPPQIRVAVEAPPERARAGEPLTFQVRAEHLFGRAAAGLSVQGHVTIQSASFAPSAWEGWQFGDADKTFAPLEISLGTQTLDGEGRASFSADSAAAWRPPAALQIVQQATVIEDGGRPVSASASRRLDAYPFYIGLRTAWEGAIRAGETQRVEVVEVLPDGAPAAAGKPVVLTLSRVLWHSALREGAGGRYEWKSERQLITVREDTLAAGGDPRTWSFAVDTTGSYLLTASDPASGASTRIAFYAASPEQDWVAWSREKPGRIELAWDRERYRPGDTARLLVKAPFSGVALLTVESDRVLEARVVTLEKNTAELEVPVLAAYAPNVYCVLTLVRPAVAESVWSPHRALGALALPVERPGRRLTVTADAPALQRPQSKLTARLTVRDEAGQPAAGAVTVMAVDEGICLLTAFQTPDPNRVFTAQRRLGVTLHDLYNELVPVLDDAITTASRMGGDGDEGAGPRRRLNPVTARRFKPVALWQADVPLNSNGEAMVALDIPEFAGTLRVMAVAYNAAQCGSAQTPVPVKRDLVVQPALPRFLAVGDRCDASVVLHNTGAAELGARVRVTCGGPLRADAGEQRVTVPAGGSARVPLTLTGGPGPGLALLRIEAEAGVDRYDETTELAVRTVSALQAQTLNRVVQPGERVSLAPPTNWMAATAARSVRISAMPAMQLGRALEQVWYYPYGCLEQTVSGAFPLLYAADWPERLMAPGAVAAGDTRARVNAAIQRVWAMQQGDGGFSLWPFEGKTDAAASLYAAHFLVEARAAGCAVAPERLDAVLDWLRQRLGRNAAIEVGSPPWLYEMDERAYVCQVLALAGCPDAGWTARLREQSGRLYYATRVRVAATLLLMGEPRQAVDILDRLGLPSPRSRLSGYLLNSDVQDAALLLSAWLDVAPDGEAPGRLALYLLNRRADGHWGNTYDNAMALLAIGKYLKHRAGREQPFTGSLTRPDGGVTAVTSTQEVQVAYGPGEVGDVILVNDGPGPMYLSGQFSGVSLTAEPATEQGVKAWREYFDSAGRPVDPATLRQGDLVIVRITVDPLGRELDQLVIEDLLPAGWEIENPNLLTAGTPPVWLRNQAEPARYRDARDDRMLFFTGAVARQSVFHYAARAVTPGVFRQPPLAVSGMYEPEIRCVSGGGEVRVTP